MTNTLHKKCKVCGKKFEIKSQSMNGIFRKSFSPWNTNMCSYECRVKNGLENARRQREQKKTKIVKRKCRTCGKEVVSTAYSPHSFCGGKFGECYKKFQSISRMGKKNPAYRNGFAIIGRRTYTGIHLRACSKYRKAFLEKHEYLFCEVCLVNANGTPKFEVHHIYFASLYPKHKELHNAQNLVLVCIGCHNLFHAGKKYEKEFKKLEKERGLKKLFKKNL